MTVESVFPLEFFVASTPLALGASAASRGRWKALLEEVARQEIAKKAELPWLDHSPLALSIFYFPPDKMDGDIDNIIKPIMDAFVGAAYPDDQVVERVLAQKFEPEVDWSFDQPSEILSAALDTEPPVVYIRIDDDLAWRRN